jgi:PAS domain S-box-containing protein
MTGGSGSEAREAVLRAVIRSTPVATVALDRRGDVQVWNRAAAVMFALTADEVIGGPPPIALDDVLARVLAGDDDASTRMRVGRGAEARDLLVRPAPLRDGEGRTVGAVIVLVDVSEEQRTLDETRAALERAESLPRPPPARPQPADADSLRNAIADGALSLYYRPVVDLTDAHCARVELEVRAHDPERGLLPASEVTGLAEEHDVGGDLAAWVVERAIVQAARWQIDRPGFGVTVALSPAELARPGFSVLLGALLRREGLAPASLAVEVGAAALADGAGRAAAEAVGALGVRVTVVGEVEGVAVDAVKVECGRVDAALVSRLHDRGIRVIGSHVDTEAQVAALVEADCDEAQGNFFAPPQPAADLEPLISGRRRWRAPGARVMRRAGRTRA